MEIKVVTDVSSEPVTSEFVKNFIKYEDSETLELALIDALIKSARQLIEKTYGLALAEQTIQVRYLMEEVKADHRRVLLPRYPISSISEVKTINYEGTETELTLNDGYYRSGDNLVYIEFPTIIGTVSTNISANDYRIKFVAGFGASDCPELPEEIKIAIAIQVADWYDRRGMEMELLSSVDAIMNKYAAYAW